MKLSPRQTRLLALPLALGLRCLGRTWRIQHGGPEQGPLAPERIDVFWHGQMLPFMYAYRGQHCATMISEHRDGALIAAVSARFGAEAVRGSSTRGGARAYLNLLRRHGDLPWVLTPDGPRGPRAQVHEGVIQMAAATGRPIRPHGLACSAARYLDSWDAFAIPRMFARIHCHAGEALAVPANIDRSSRLEFAQELRRRILLANERATAALRCRPTPAAGNDCLQS